MTVNYKNPNSNIITILNKNIDHLKMFNQYILSKNNKNQYDDLKIKNCNNKIEMLLTGIDVINTYPYKIHNINQLINDSVLSGMVDQYFINTLDYIIKFNRFETIQDPKFMVYIYNTQNKNINNVDLDEDEDEDLNIEIDDTPQFDTILKELSKDPSIASLFQDSEDSEEDDDTLPPLIKDDMLPSLIQNQPIQKTETLQIETSNDILNENDYVLTGCGQITSIIESINSFNGLEEIKLGLNKLYDLFSNFHC